MKKIGIIATLFFTTIIIILISVHIREKNTDVTQSQTKVGVLLNGPLHDRSWGESHYEGLEKSALELNLDIIYRENIPENSDCLDVMEDLVKEGCKIIICNSFSYGEWELQMSHKYPDVYFFHATGVETSKNLSTYFGRIYQMRYLTGIIAGLTTKTNEIGYVAAFPISEVNRGINAFTLGVKYVNPDATVYVKWSNDWHNDEVTAKAANELFDSHNIDVTAMHTDSLAVLSTADERGIYSIGYNYDNSSMYPKTFLTAPVWNWYHFYSTYILEALQGKLSGDSYWLGAETGIVALSPMTNNVSEEAKKTVESEKKKLESMDFDVFYGPIYDTEGRLRVQEDENMSDDSMLNSFDWYVEGVVIDE